MNELVLHPVARKKIDHISANLPQSLLLTGDFGVGLYTIAKKISGRRLSGEVHPTNIEGGVESAGGTIRVSQIRELYELTRAGHRTPQVYIIDNADLMNNGSQSAFLKLLEEPNQNIHFILTSHSPQNLLATIKSRMQSVHIRLIEAGQSIGIMDKLDISDQKRRAQLMFMADGLPAEMIRLINDQDYFNSRAEIIGDARSLLQSDKYSQLLVIRKYKNDRTKAVQLIDSMMQILQKSIKAAPQDCYVEHLESLLILRNNLNLNCNILLQLTGFVVQ